MDGNHPKRKKDKQNPYILEVKGNQFYLSFKNGQGVLIEIEISKTLYDLFDSFELEDISHLNKASRHYEHSELTEQSLNNRAFHKEESVEDTVTRNIQTEQLHRAIAQLPETQRRRLTLYYFGRLTYEQIAEMEGCTFQAVAKSITAAEKRLKKYFE